MFVLYIIPPQGLASVIGPFESELQAQAFARRNLQDGDEFQIAPMESPARYN